MRERFKRHTKNLRLQAVCLAVSCFTCGLSVGGNQSGPRIAFHVLIAGVLIATFYASMRMLERALSDDRIF